MLFRSGVETILVRVGEGPVLQAPLTYRGAPLEGADAFLITEMEHSVLGPRWVYDAVGDPVYADVLHRAIVTGGTEADLQTAVDGRLEPGPKSATAQGSGTAADAPTITSVQVATSGQRTTITTGVGDLVVLRVLGADAPSGETLDVEWEEGARLVAAFVARFSPPNRSIS